jgi:hypothetical protein
MCYSYDQMAFPQQCLSWYPCQMNVKIPAGIKPIRLGKALGWMDRARRFLILVFVEKIIRPFSSEPGDAVKEPVPVIETIFLGFYRVSVLGYHLAGQWLPFEAGHQERSVNS